MARGSNPRRVGLGGELAISAKNWGHAVTLRADLFDSLPFINFGFADFAVIFDLCCLRGAGNYPHGVDALVIAC